MYAQIDLRKYAPKGSKVKIIRQTIDGVCLVEFNGERFPCRIEQLGEVPPDAVVKEVVNDEFKLF